MDDPVLERLKVITQTPRYRGGRSRSPLRRWMEAYRSRLEQERQGENFTWGAVAEAARLEGYRLANGAEVTARALRRLWAAVQAAKQGELELPSPARELELRNSQERTLSRFAREASEASGSEPSGRQIFGKITKKEDKP